MVGWFEISAMRVNPDKFQGMLLKVWVILRLQSRAMKSLLCRKSMHWVCVYMSSYLGHVDHICTRASRQVSAMQRLGGVLDCEVTLASYTNLIVVDTK